MRIGPTLELYYSNSRSSYEYDMLVPSLNGNKCRWFTYFFITGKLGFVKRIDAVPQPAL